MEENPSWQIDAKAVTFDKRIGAGQFGVVYQGTFLGTPVAVKRIFYTDQTPQVAVKYIEREIGNLAKLKHPNVVQFLGRFLKDNDIFVVTEWAEEGDVSSKLQDPAWSFSWKLKVGILRDVARAMTYLHTKETMHRDLKTANILLTSNWVAKVCDFGFARQKPKMGEVATVVGTPAYMAPEVLLRSPYELPADVFSYGIIMYEVIMRDDPPGRLILEGFRFASERLECLLPEDVPKGLWDLLCKCTLQETAERPTFPEILDAISAIYDRIGGGPEKTYDKGMTPEAKEKAKKVFREWKKVRLREWVNKEKARLKDQDSTPGITSSEGQEKGASRPEEEGKGKDKEKEKEKEKVEEPDTEKIPFKQVKPKRERREGFSTPSEEVKLACSADDELPTPPKPAVNVRASTGSVRETEHGTSESYRRPMGLPSANSASSCCVS